MIVMKIETKFFGEIEVEERQVIYFKYGIPGLEDYKKYIMLDIEGKEDLKCIQSIEEKDVCLLSIDPWKYFEGYEINLSDEEIEDLEVSDPESVVVYNVVTVRGDRITANLVAPIIINVLKNKGKQIILTNTKYEIRQEIPCLY
jgi:flagellar assembly factor FliW